MLSLWPNILANSEPQHLVLGLIRSVVRGVGGVCQNLGVGTGVWDHSLQFYLFISFKITKQNIPQKDKAVSLQLKIPLLRASAHQLLN